MGTTTKIVWCQHTASMWRGCTHGEMADGSFHEGCSWCYAEAMAKRNPKTLGKWGKEEDGGTRILASRSYWQMPFKWSKAAEEAGEHRRVFCASISDVFEDWRGKILNNQEQPVFICQECHFLNEWGTIVVEREDPTCNYCDRRHSCRYATMQDLRVTLFKVIDKTPWLDWMLLTKRPQNIREMWPVRKCPQCHGTKKIHDEERGIDGECPTCEGSGTENYRANCWCGTSVSDQRTFDEFAAHLSCLHDIASVLFLSAEPLLGPIDLSQYADEIDLVIIGGESGPHARPCYVDWISSLVLQCKENGTAAFAKQLGSKPRESYYLDDGERREFLLNQKHKVWQDQNLEWEHITHGQPSPTAMIEWYPKNKGGDMEDFPVDIRVREFPVAG